MKADLPTRDNAAVVHSVPAWAGLVAGLTRTRGLGGIAGLAVAVFLAGCSPSESARTGPADSGTNASAATSPDVPEWAKDAIWYQIFPERFRNGDPANDPTVDVVARAWPYRRPEGWQPTRWTSDWYARDEWELGTSDDFYVTVQARRYGGDLAGMLEALPYLDSLGVTALYLNPMFDAPSLHKYDGSTFHHIDVHFGPDPSGDRALIAAEDPVDPTTWSWTSADRQFMTFVSKAHELGMRIILDGVFNHMGLESFVFRDVAERQQASRFADWIDVLSWDDPATPDTNEFDYRGWIGVKSLPELTEDENGLLPPIREYVFAATSRWMDPNGDGDPSDGIDGWRLDVSEMVDSDFWRVFRKHVRGIRSDAYIVGELWWEDWQNNRMFDASPWIQGDQYDAVMNYRWALPARRLFIGSDLEPGESYGPSRFLADLSELRSMYPTEAQFVQMNTYGSHDTDRPSSQAANPGTVFDHRTNIRENADYVIGKPTREQFQTLRLMLAHQFTYIGAPHLFYGDEAGMWGGDDPDERKPMVWPDMTYDDEAAHPFGLERTADPVAFDRELFAYYQRLIRLRLEHPSLRRGAFETLASDDGAGTLVYRRTFGRDRVWVVLNVSDVPREVSFDASPVIDRHETRSPVVALVDAFSGWEIPVEQTTARATATATVPARTALILVAR